MGLTWDLLLHTDALDLLVAFGADAVITALGVLTLLVLSWTHLCVTLIHIWRRAKVGSPDCWGPTCSTS